MFTSQVRDAWFPYRCTPGVRVPTGFFGRHTVYAANAEVVTAVQALELGHLNSGYVPTEGAPTGSKRWCPDGIGGLTCEGDGKNCSLHNYCLAIDVEYSLNRYIRARVDVADFAEDWFPAVCKYTLAQVYAIEGIKNTHGEQMWKWLGWTIGDFMHWQINVSPDRMEVDWNTVPSESVEGEDMEQFYQDILDQWSHDELVEMEQAGSWSGNPDYYKGEGATPHPDDVKAIVINCLSAGTVLAHQGDAETLKRGDEVILI